MDDTELELSPDTGILRRPLPASMKISSSSMERAARTKHLSAARHRLFLAAACVLIAGTVAGPAAAEQDRPIMLQVGSTGGWNSNIFLTPNNTQSVYYAAPYVGLIFDKAYAQQEFQANVTETFYRYSQSSLDASALAYSGAWLWHMTPGWTGTISGGRTASVNNFSQFQSTNGQSFVVTTYNSNFNLDGIIFGGWHLLAGGSFLQSNNSQQFQALGSYREYGMADTGIKYVAGSGSWISAVNRWVQGDYFDQQPDPTTLLDNRYQEQENGLKSSWLITGKSTVNTRLSWLARRYQNFSQRNYSGPRGQITYSLGSAADKLRLNVGYTRDIAAYLTDQSSYTITNTVSIIPSWQVSQKIAVHMDLERATWSYRGPAVSSFPLRGDTVLSALLGADWTPLRYLALSASAQRSHRSSNIFADEYNDTLVNISASLKF